MKVTKEQYQELLAKSSNPKPKTHHTTPERAIQLAILKYLKMKNYPCGKTKTVGGRIGNKFLFDPYTFRGFPDLVAFIPQLVFIEVKAIKGIQSDHQKWFQELCRIAGVSYLLVYSLDEFIEKIVDLELRKESLK